MTVCRSRAPARAAPRAAPGHGGRRLAAGPPAPRPDPAQRQQVQPRHPQSGASDPLFTHFQGRIQGEGGVGLGGDCYFGKFVFTCNTLRTRYRMSETLTCCWGESVHNLEMRRASLIRSKAMRRRNKRSNSCQRKLQLAHEARDKRLQRNSFLTCFTLVVLVTCHGVASHRSPVTRA